MKFIEIDDTGFDNSPIIDLDRVMYVQWYIVRGDAKCGGKIRIGFFGVNDPVDLRFTTESYAIDAYKKIRFLLKSQTLTEAMEDKL